MHLRARPHERVPPVAGARPGTLWHISRRPPRRRNVTADALQALKRVLLWIVSGHFVDDFNGVDIEDLADGVFHGMAQFFELLGLQTKPSKAQAPAPAHVVQGVLVAVGEEGVVLKPTPERIKKVTATIDKALRTDEMTPEVAGKLAGRLNFITQATFGALGKAALKPVYSRAHDAAASASSGLSAGLRAALMALKALLADIQPRVIPYIDDDEPQAIIYADAFYQPGETRYKAGHFPAEVPVKPGSKGSNGWGFVVRIGATVLYDCGTAPADFLDLFASRRAFIYVLEILAQVLALVTLSRHLPARWLAFMDNVAGQWALTKGYGRDESVNGVLAAFWSTAALAEWLPDFRRVPSKANVSDAVSWTWRRGWDGRGSGHQSGPSSMCWQRLSATSTSPSMGRRTSCLTWRFEAEPARFGAGERSAGSRMRPRRRPALYWRFCDGPRRDAPFIHPKRRARR